MATTLPLGRRERFAQWWQLRTAAERSVIVIATAIVAVLLLWAIVWEPLQRDSERLARHLAEQRSALLVARRQADAIAGLARNAPATGTREARAAIEAALARQTLKSTAGPIERIDDEHWRLSFGGVAFDALTALLESLQRDSGLRAAEVSATARVEPGQVRADVTLTR
jgi:type II secretory pathway component PulM